MGKILKDLLNYYLYQCFIIMFTCTFYEGISKYISKKVTHDSAANAEKTQYTPLNRKENGLDEIKGLTEMNPWKFEGSNGNEPLKAGYPADLKNNENFYINIITCGKKWMFANAHPNAR